MNKRSSSIVIRRVISDWFTIKQNFVIYRVRKCRANLPVHEARRAEEFGTKIVTPSSGARRNRSDLEKFDFYKFSEHYDDYKYAMELTSEILFLEVIYRILVCIFEAFCLSSSVGRTGGATPGKALLGIRIVTASAVIPVEGRPRETVLLYPGRTLSFTVALVRSLMKNFLISLLFPLCVVLFVFRHNRTGYDLLCGVIVVEENMFPPRRHAP